MLTENYDKNIRQAVEILKQAGCREIFLFGSLAENAIREGSDIDIAVRGCPKGKFFHLLGKLLLKLDIDVDLVDLDENDAFPCYLIQNERLVQIG
ncbi:MAG: nucleotidyltransferase family protein [Desulfococcaceae bacterium]